MCDGLLQRIQKLPRRLYADTHVVIQSLLDILPGLSRSDRRFHGLPLICARKSEK